LVAAGGPLTLGLLTSRVYQGPNALRYAAVTMCAVFLVGLAALPFAPVTKGMPLPELSGVGPIIYLLRQGHTLRLRRERQRGQTDQKHRAHRDGRIAKRIRTLIDAARQQPQRQRTAGGN